MDISASRYAILFNLVIVAIVLLSAAIFAYATDIIEDGKFAFAFVFTVAGFFVIPLFLLFGVINVIGIASLVYGLSKAKKERTPKKYFFFGYRFFRLYTFGINFDLDYHHNGKLNGKWRSGYTRKYIRFTG